LTTYCRDRDGRCCRRERSLDLCLPEAPGPRSARWTSATSRWRMTILFPAGGTGSLYERDRNHRPNSGREDRQGCPGRSPCSRWHRLSPPPPSPRTHEVPHHREQGSCPSARLGMISYPGPGPARKVCRPSGRGTSRPLWTGTARSDRSCSQRGSGSGRTGNMLHKARYPRCPVFQSTCYRGWRPSLWSSSWRDRSRWAATGH